MDAVQVEPGKYKLTTVVYYQPRAGRLRRKVTKKATSSITFSIDSTIREHIKSGLIGLLQEKVASVLLGQQRTWHYPEYQPLEVKEA